LTANRGKSIYRARLTAPKEAPTMYLPAPWPAVAPVLLLIVSNIFMTFAWYGHLKFKSTPLMLAILVSWGIAFFEYCLAVPANRIGSAVYSTAQLKTMQEVITLVVFAGFSVLYLKEPLGWNHIAGFALIAAGAALVFHRFG
jgi:uncharacterized protein (DUF486 family)